MRTIEIPEKTRRPTASSGTIPTFENPVTWPGIEPGSPWWEESLRFNDKLFMSRLLLMNDRCKQYPAGLDDLRRWTSQEAIGDVTVAPDCSARIAPSTDPDIDQLDHRLPSPEEQVQTVALRFPSEVVLVDTSGRAFDRMSLLRRSLVQVDGEEVRRRGGKGRRPRSKRRNTIAGTDQKELVEAVVGDITMEGEDATDAIRPLDSLPAIRSASTDFLRSKEESPTDTKKSHFNSLKQWGKVKLRLIRSSSTDKTTSLSGSHEDSNIYEAVGAKGSRKLDLKYDRRTSKSSAGTNLPISSSSGPMSMAVKLRENSLLRRKKERMWGRCNALLIWELECELREWESITGTSSNSLSQPHNHNPPSSSSVGSRRKFITTSASSSFSEGTLTPDIAPSDIGTPFFPDDGETSSVYSCDTEGYYTSFHMDSGLKTLKEEDPAGTLQVPLQSTSALSVSPNRSSTLTAENEYELFGKGSTSTTTSSAGTVCTTLMFGNEGNLSGPTAPAVPERKSSLEPVNSLERNMQKVTVMIHEHKDDGTMSESPDSGHNTSSSPVGSTNSPQGTLTGRSSEYEFSESDLEGFDRIERIRVKTTINSSRIPSMCVITPPQSDDEISLSQYGPLYRLPNSASLPSSDIHCSENDSHNNKETSDSRHHYRVSPRRFEKQLSTDSDRSSESEFTKVSPRILKKNSLSRLDKVSGSTVRSDDSFPSRSPSGETVIFNGTTENSLPRLHTEEHHKPSAEPQNSILDKVKGVLADVGKRTHCPKSSVDASTTSEEKISPVDTGDYVTIIDAHGNRTQSSHQPSSYAPQYSNMVKKTPTATSARFLTRETEYVSLNELPSSGPTQNTIPSPADSLERKKRQGARVTLDSEGKVVYSSDSLKRNKGGYSSFEPGPYVKDAITSPVASPMTAHRVPKSNIRPVTLSSHGLKSPVMDHSTRRSTSPSAVLRYPTSPQLGKVIIRAGGKTSSMTRVSSPTPVVVPSSTNRPLSPRQATRGAYVNVQSPDDPHRQHCVTSGRSTPSTSPTEDEEGKIPPCPSNPKLTSYLQRTNPALYSRISDAVPNSKIKRSDSYRLANSPVLQTRKMSNIELAANVNVNKNGTNTCKTFKSNNNVDTLGGNKNDRKVLAEFSNGKVSFNTFKSDVCEGNKVKCVMPGPTASEDGTKVVENPNVKGRKFYGPQIRVDPNLLAAPVGKATSPVVSKETERARVLAYSGKPPPYAVHHGNLLPSQSQHRSTADPSRAVHWDPRRSMVISQGQSSPSVFWTLPSRRSLHETNVVQYSQPPHSDSVSLARNGSGRYNTIATSGIRAQHSRVPPQHSQNYSPAAHYSSLVVQPTSCQPATVQVQKNFAFVPNPARHAGNVNPVSIPEVPRNIAEIRTANYSGSPYVARGLNSYKLQERFYSSTPEKNESVVRQLQHSMKPTDFSDTLSPIERVPRREEKMMIPSCTADKKISSQLDYRNNNDANINPQPLKYTSQTKTSMTAEEIFAAIHKSRKKLNIKSELGTRSNSPCSSAASVSPGSSEMSLNGEQGSMKDAEANRNRHSWSPNSDESRNIYVHLEQKAYSPATSPGSRQSWAGDRLGSKQQTSRNDFKRLLLQHGSSHGGSLRGRMSAVEQLKLSKQQKENNNAKTCVSRSPADKRGNGSKLLQSPRSLANWKFASPRTDVLSSTILEDCAEEENTSGSPQDNTSKSAVGSEKGRGSGTARRLLNFSSEAEKKDHMGVKPVLEQYTREPSVRRSPPSTSPLWTKKADLNIPQSKSTFQNHNFPPEPLSPSNVKENVDTNQQLFSPRTLALLTRGYGTPNSRYQSVNKLDSLKTSPTTHINALLAKQRNYPNHPSVISNRSALVTLDAQVSPKTTLETAL
ncbi:hypothetical protein PR048_030458 [Dryococelus australis]|uniref:WASP family protein member n=1 Tax=Dryococelus australis TaxID=614101 RepID=A0ABQ9GBR0_9NEOP|nr:hypothetical protein PR048_030458 [Dryococelus australis]